MSKFQGLLKDDRFQVTQNFETGWKFNWLKKYLELICDIFPDDLPG